MNPAKLFLHVHKGIKDCRANITHGQSLSEGTLTSSPYNQQQANNIVPPDNHKTCNKYYEGP